MPSSLKAMPLGDSPDPTHRSLRPARQAGRQVGRRKYCLVRAAHRGRQQQEPTRCRHAGMTAGSHWPIHTTKLPPANPPTCLVRLLHHPLQLLQALRLVVAPHLALMRARPVDQVLGCGRLACAAAPLASGGHVIPHPCHAQQGACQQDVVALPCCQLLGSQHPRRLASRPRRRPAAPLGGRPVELLLRGRWPATLRACCCRRPAGQALLLLRGSSGGGITCNRAGRRHC